MTLVQEHSGAEGRPIIVLEELTEIDPASLGVLAEAAMSPGWNALIVMTLPRGASVPPQLSAANLQDLSLSPLPLDDKIAVAEAVLGLEPGSEIAQRIAHSCGDSAHSVIEAVRTLVSAGDLVQREERFVWRIGPRQGGSAVPVEALITERVSGLIPSAYRVLEIICAAPRHAGREFLEQVAMHDGVNAEEFADGLDPLRVEGFVDDALSLGRGDAALRGALRNIMPPARAAELHRFVADLLRIRMPRPCFGSGELAFHLAEGGQNTAAAAALIDAAHAATEAGFQRVAMRLLATAVDWDGSTQTRKATSELARAVGAAGRPSGRAHSSASTVAAVTVTEEEYEELKSSDLELPSEMAQAAMRSALQAFNHRDYDSVERWLDAAVAAGGGRIAAQRVLAMAHVARGELQDAARTLQRATGNAEVSAAVRARDTLSWSILHLAAGDPQQSVREALSALAQNRTLRDQLGATAALRVLAMGYRVLERAAEAERLEAAAGALGPAAPLASHPA
jgi:hypothetical protein